MRSQAHICFVFFISFLPQILAAQDSTERLGGSKGEIHVVNWAPSHTNGPVLRQTSLNYEYWLSNGDLAQKFRFYYDLSEVVMVDGKAYKKNEIGDELYDELKIQSISFKAKVYQGDQYKGEILIAYPDIAAFSGGESGWYVIKGVEWDEVFVDMGAKKAKGIFESGFELKETEIVGIGYHGIDTIEKLIRKKEAHLVANNKDNAKDTRVQNGGSGRNGSALVSNYEDESNNKRKKTFRESDFVGFVFDLDKKKNAKTSFVPWRFNLDLGLSYLRYPIVINSQVETISQSTSSVEQDSYKGTGGGYLFNGQGSYWFLYGRKLGIAINSGLAVGGIPKLSNKSYSYFSWNYGASLYSGAVDQKVKLLLEYNRQMNYGIYFGRSERREEQSNVYVAQLGIAEYDVTSFKMGAKIWISSPTFRTLDLMVRFDKMLIPYVSSYYVMAYEARLWRPYFFSVDLIVSPSHPIIGDPLYFNPDLPSSGMMFQLKLSKTIDYFARPHFVKQNSGRRIWK